ncbi:C-terminal binding protein [Shimia abyssi]|uniref:D-3-phosphoglycerate dehydrogenase n=1 Tax=Shimia abyssi TaxID=1662395 RepID=A0A2P8FHD1_9RHOB|nr:C-terminal binding protein [Shimia abyssi]PSL21151.1 D-3-phosphoglycerate dehydrogenase [Shimia abyssi]
MTSQTIAILEPGYARYDTERSVLAQHDVQVLSVAGDVEAVPALQALDPVAILVRERTVDKSVINACPNLKVVVRYGVGVDNLDLDLLRARGIYAANVPDYGAETEVSEHALALYLAVQRRVPSRDIEIRDGKWGIGQAAMIPNRENAILGLIGCGKIGLKAAEKFRALGFTKVMVFDPYMTDENATTADVEKVDLDTLCSSADVISLHAPLTPETHHILNADRIAQMKPTSIVVNVSRGGLVDEAALAEALVEGRIFGAGIDVFEQEPVSQDHPLLKSPNTVVSDHAAWYSERSVAVLQSNAAHEIDRVLQGQAPQSWVNPW